MEHPPPNTLVSILENTPPENADIARQWFAAMATRITGLSLYSWFGFDGLFVRRRFYSKSYQETFADIVCPYQGVFHQRGREGDGKDSSAFTDAVLLQERRQYSDTF